MAPAAIELSCLALVVGIGLFFALYCLSAVLLFGGGFFFCFSFKTVNSVKKGN